MKVKKMISGLLACSMFFSMFGVAYASPVAVKQSQSVNYEHKFRISKEDFTTYVTYHEIPQTLDIEVVDKNTGEKVFEANDVFISTFQSWLEKPIEGARQKRFVFVIPLAWGAAEIAAAFVSGLAMTATTAYAVDEIGKTVKSYQDSNDSVYYSKKQEIEDAESDIPKKLKKEDDSYSVDTSKFNQKITGDMVAYKEPKTGWVIEKSNSEHLEGEKWKLYNKQGKMRKRIATLSGEGKILGK